MGQQSLDAKQAPPLTWFAEERFRLSYGYVFEEVAAEQARLSFFEYVAVRKAKSLFCKPSERRRLFGIERLLAREFDRWEVLRECVLGNAPPVWVHHLQLPGSAVSRRSKLVADAP